MRHRKKVYACSLLEATGTEVVHQLRELRILERFVVGVALSNVSVREVVLEIAEDRFKVPRNVTDWMAQPEALRG